MPIKWLIQQITAMKFWNRNWKYVPKESGEQFVFIHIPKTAGTTFRFILYNHFDKKQIYPTPSELKKNKGLYLSQEEFIAQNKSLSRSMIVGHFYFGIKNHLESQVKTLAFFRNPIDRVFSTIKHIKKHDAQFKEMDLNEIVHKNFHRIMNAQSGAFGFNFKDRNAKVLRNNIKSLDFIGITEYFDESIQLCNATFDWQLENIPPKNKIDLDVYSKLSSQTMCKISSAILPEIITYEVALNNFRFRCKKHKIELV